MTAFTSRPYTGVADLQAMIDLLIAVRAAERIADYPSIVDLREMSGTPDTQANTRLWEDEAGQLVGFAIVDVAFSNLLFEIASQATGRIETYVIAWGVEPIRQARRDHGQPLTLDTSCHDDNTERMALRERHGFVPQEASTLLMIRPLNEPIPTPHVPAGFAIRHVVGENEVEAYVALHHAAFGTEHMTIEHRLAMMRAPEYDPALDLIAVAPDGTFAAFCMCHISQQENAQPGRNEGWTDPVGTRPEFRRRGLARALLLTGFHLLKQRGVETAMLSVSSENTAGRRAFASVGFHKQSTKISFAKQVREH